MRTWIVAFWAFVVAQSDGAAPLGPSRRERDRHAAVAAGERAGERGRFALRPTPRHHRRHDRVGSGRIGDRLERRGVATAIAGARPHLWPDRFRRLRGAYVRHDCKRRADASRRDLGVTFDGGIWPCRARRLGRRRRTRRRRRAGAGRRDGSPCSRCSRQESFSARSLCGGRSEKSDLRIVGISQ